MKFNFTKKSFSLIALSFVAVSIIGLLLAANRQAPVDLSELPDIPLEEYIRMADDGDVYALQYLISAHIVGSDDIPKDLDKARYYAHKLEAYDPKTAKIELDSINLMERLEADTNATAKRAVLELEGYTCNHKGGDYVITEGNVKNLSIVPVKGITAVVTHHTKNETFITSDTALIEYEVLMPDQSSPFKIYTRYNPLMDGCSLSFKDVNGQKILFDRKF